MRHDARSPLAALVRASLLRLRYPYLVLALGGLLLVDLLVPDPIPLVDELMLAILTFIAASFTTRRDDRQPPRDVTPTDEAGEDPGPPSALPR